jgi:hypothetical protein
MFLRLFLLLRGKFRGLGGGEGFVSFGCNLDSCKWRFVVWYVAITFVVEFP